MESAGLFVAAYSSDEDDCVSMDEDELNVGIQSAVIKPKAPPLPQAAPLAPQAPPPPPIGGLPLLINQNNNANANQQQQQEQEDEELVASKRINLLQKLNRKKQKGKAIHKEKINTNIVSLNLGTLGDKAKIATGDPFFCSNKNCKVMLSKFDELGSHNENKESEDDIKIWKCQFCGTKNEIDIIDEEIPKYDTMDYIMEMEQKENQKKENEGHLIIFAIDISGSMCVTQEVEGRFDFKGSKSLKDISKEFAAFGDGSDQYLPNQKKKNVTWVSRLECVKAAIGDQLQNMIKNNPNNKVCLITFDSEVCIIGDGISKPVYIAGDKLKNQDLLKEIGSSYKLTDKTIKDTSKNLQSKLYALSENGQTALGPALVVSMALASQKAASTIILCTDGMANVGLGNLEDLEKNNAIDILNDDDNHENVEKEFNWYEELGNWGLLKGITLNVISITDAECQLEQLGKVCDITGGNVERINPLELNKNFTGIFENKILATNVSATIFMHPCLKFKQDDDQPLKNEPQKKPPSPKLHVSKKDPNKDPPKKNNQKEENQDADNKKDKEEMEIEKEEEVKITIQKQDIGNAFKDTKIYFEYIISKKDLKTKKYSKLSEIPFQVQIEYCRASDNRKIIRVITQIKKISKDRKEVLKNLNYEVLGSHVSRQVGSLAENGDYESARMKTYSHALWMGKNAVHKAQKLHFNDYMENNTNFDALMQEQQITEQSEIANSNNNDAWSFFSWGKGKKDEKEKVKDAKKSKKKKLYRSSNRKDQMSKEMYKFKKF